MAENYPSVGSIIEEIDVKNPSTKKLDLFCLAIIAFLDNERDVLRLEQLLKRLDVKLKTWNKLRRNHKIIQSVHKYIRRELLPRLYMTALDNDTKYIRRLLSSYSQEEKDMLREERSYLEDLQHLLSEYSREKDKIKDYSASGRVVIDIYQKKDGNIGVSLKQES